MAAFLERILLDDAGNIRPQYSEEAAPDGNLSVGDRDPTGGFAASSQDQDNRANDNVQDQWQNGLPESRHDAPEQNTRASNPLKRKLDKAHSENWLLALDDFDLSQHLPDQPLLVKVAEFFCISFHHWIPYVHKQRLQRRVCEGSRDAGFDLFLHALVAAVLRHMNPNTVSLDQDQIQSQIATSRSVVETKAIQHVSVESLQALIIIVFDHVSLISKEAPFYQYFGD
jgi:hypothetical protein